MAREKKKRDAFLIRIDPEVLADVKRLAEADLRTINGQIEFLLREAVAKRLGKKAPPPKAETESEAEEE